MNISLYQWFICFILIFAGCSKDSENSSPQVPESIIQKTMEIFDGTVLEKSASTEEGIASWELKIQNSSGAVVVFYWNRQNDNLVKIKGTTGPFDYSINPGSGLLNFSSAKTLAIGAIKNDQITSWTLNKENKFNDLWTYTFEFDSNSSSKRVYVDAETGNILQID